MLVTCIEDLNRPGYSSNALTLNKEYKVLDSSDNMYIIINNFGFRAGYTKHRFEIKERETDGYL